MIDSCELDSALRSMFLDGNGHTWIELRFSRGTDRELSKVCLKRDSGDPGGVTVSVSGKAAVRMGPVDSYELDDDGDGDVEVSFFRTVGGDWRIPVGSVSMKLPDCEAVWTFGGGE